MSTTEVKSAPTSEQPQPTTENESTKPSESPNTTKKSYKGALTTEEAAKQQTENNTTTTTTTTPTESTTASEADSTNNETRKPRASSKSKSINLHKPAWKNNKKKVTKEEEGEVLADPQAWPTLDQVTTTQSAPKEKKKDSPREETKELQNSNSSESKKKSANWVPLPIEVQTRSSSNSAPRRGRGGMRNGQPHQNNSNSTSNQTQQPHQNNNNNRGNWRKPNTRGGNSMRGRGGRGGYNNYAPGAVVYYPPPVEGESLKSALLWQVEYYFSVENLCKDLYLRQQMDEEGWIPLSLVSNFNRIKYLTSDLNTLIETIKTSSVVEYSDDKIRKKEDWKTWLIPKGSTQ